MPKYYKGLLMFVGIIFALKLMVAFHGFPDGWHPDEWRIVLETLSMAQNKNLIPANVNYPLFFRYVILFCYGIWYLFGRITNFFSTPWDFALLFFKRPEIFLIIPRLINVTLSIVIVLVGYKVAKKFFDEKVALISAVFLCLEYQLFAHSIYGLHQVSAALSTLPVFYFARQSLYRLNIRNSILLGIAVGVAASIHQTAILFIPSLFYLFIVQPMIDKKTNLKHIFIFTLVTLLFSLLGNLFWLLDFGKTLAFYKLGNEVSKIAFSSHQVFDYNLPSFLIWLFKEIIIQDLIIGLFMVAGIFRAFYKHRREDIFFLIFFMSYILFFYTWAFRWLHLLIGLIPILTIYGAKVASFCIEKLKPRKNLVFLAIVAFFLISVYSLSPIFIVSVMPESREVAREWITKNIDQNQRVALDWAAYNVNLPSPIPVFLRNPIGRRYFNDQIPNSIKSSLIQSKNYQIVEAMYQTNEPIWPSNMPADKVAKAQKSSIFRDLYSYYNFLDFDKLATEADYLIISSYSYDMFLYDNDIHKTNPFNPYLKDEIGKYQSHIEGEAEDNQHGLLAYVAQRGRDFYLPLLRNEDRRFKEIQRFQPSQNLSGPTLIIYKIIH